MIKEKKEKPVKIEKPKVEKKSYFPKLLMIFSIVLIVVAVNDYFRWLVFPMMELWVDILLLLAGLWMLRISIATGFSKKRKEIFKKYI